MRSREELQDERLKLVGDRQEALRKKVQVIEGWLLSELIQRLLGLSTDDDGKLKNNLTNIAKADSISTTVFSSMRQELGKTFASWLVNGIRRLLGINATYFKTMESYSAKTVDNAAVKLVLRHYGYDLDNNLILQDSWLDNLLAAKDVKQKVIQRVNTALAGQMPLSEFKKTFRQDFLSNQTGLGLLARHYETHTGNLYAAVDRQAQNIYRGKLGLRLAVYAGTIKDNTRDFCRERVQHVYTLEEIEGWNNLDWEGKIPGADVKIALGGYGPCRHQLNWVTETVANQIASKTGGINAYG